jgi:hypothetical protein
MGQTTGCAVVLHGGMGNQLFQWAYGHSLAAKGFPVNFVFYEKPYLLDHTRESLEKYLYKCEHGDFLKVKLSRNKLIRVLQDPTHPRNIKTKINKKLRNTLQEPFTILPGLRATEIYFGYYQNSSMVYELKDELIPELLTCLENRELSKLEKQLEGSEVIHIRQGDTKTPKNMERVGVLDSLYYSNLPKRRSDSRIVVTDDVLGAKVMLSNHDVDGVYGQSSTLFTANSTLSWWGGVLAQSYGSTVYIPEPFFRNMNPAPGSAFNYPGFNRLPSSFLSPESN